MTPKKNKVIIFLAYHEFLAVKLIKLNINVDQGQNVSALYLLS